MQHPEFVKPSLPLRLNNILILLKLAELSKSKILIGMAGPNVLVCGDILKSQSLTKCTGRPNRTKLCASASPSSTLFEAFVPHPVMEIY
jgi:hypothetical protein